MPVPRRDIACGKDRVRHSLAKNHIEFLDVAMNEKKSKPAAKTAMAETLASAIRNRSNELKMPTSVSPARGF